MQPPCQAKKKSEIERKLLIGNNLQPNRRFSSVSAQCSILQHSVAFCIAFCNTPL